MEDEPFEVSLTRICVGLCNVRFLSVMLPDKPSELSHMYVCMYVSSLSDATSGVKQTACLCLLRLLRVNASHVPIDQYANKIVQLLNEK